MLGVNPALPVTSVAELIAYGKANPGKLTFGSAGIGSTLHLAERELFKRARPASKSCTCPTRARGRRSRI